MKNVIEIVFFDLFFTLVTPKYNNHRNENDVLGITKDEWEFYSEDNDLYLHRAIGREKNPKKIIESIVEKMTRNVSENEVEEILKLREERFKNALINVDQEIINVLIALKKSGKKLCLISNADIIDVMYWDESPLSELFDATVFSYEVGYLKPEIQIYESALNIMKTTPEKCIFIGDGGSDELKSAKELGMKTIQTAYLLKKEKKDISAIKNCVDYYIEDFKNIVTLINGGIAG